MQIRANLAAAVWRLTELELRKVKSRETGAEFLHSSRDKQTSDIPRPRKARHSSGWVTESPNVRH